MERNLGCKDIFNQTMLKRIGEEVALAGCMREVIEKPQERRKPYGTRTILFVKDVVETLN